jgi:hypothetical protein
MQQHCHCEATRRQAELGRKTIESALAAKEEEEEETEKWQNNSCIGCFEISGEWADRN